MGDRGKRRKRSKNTNYYCPELPLEIVYVILLMIPARFLLKLKFVCKSWYNLISSSAFIRSHTLLSKDEDTHLLVRCQTPFFKAQSISLYSLLNNSISTSYDICFSFTNTHGEGMLVGSCKGIICLSFDDGSVILWNPCTRESEILCNSGCQLGSGSYGVYGFAYLDSTDKFLVVCLSTSSNEVFEYVTQTKVFSSKAQGWRRISDFLFGTPFFTSGKFASGSLYWLASREPAFNLGIFFDNNSPWVLVSFDVEKEMYIELVPPQFVGNDYDLSLGILKQCLSILCNYGNSHADFWVLTTSAGSWNKLFTIPYTDGPSSFQYSSPLCMSTNGDILLEFGFQILLYTPNDKKTTVLQIDNFGGCVEAVVYFESFISPKMEPLKVEAKRIMSREEQQVSKAKKHTDGGKYGGAENDRKRKFFVSGLPLTLSEAESFSSENGASCGYGGPAGAANGNPTVCDAGFGRGSPGPSGFWYGSSGIGFGYGSYGGTSSRHGGTAVAPNGKSSVCNDVYERGPPGAAKNAPGYGKNRWKAGCSGYGETLESYENPGAYTAVGGHFGSGLKGKRSAGGEIKHGDRAQMNGTNGEDKLGCSGYGETLESYENPGAYTAVGGRFGSGLKGKRSAGGEIKHGDRAQMNGTNGEDKLGC